MGVRDYGIPREARVMGCPGDGPGQFIEPNGVAVSACGKLVVADSRTNRLQLLHSDRSHIRTICEYGSAPGQFSCPTGVVIGKDDRIVVADTGNHRVQKSSARMAASCVVLVKRGPLAGGLA